MLNPAPELAELSKPVGWRVAGNQGSIDRTNRGADHPVGFNPGVTFGLFAGSGAVGRWALSAVASLIIGALLAWIWRTRSAVTAAAAGLIAGGAIGNLVDRLRFGAVTDFIDLHWGAAHWPTFNLADAAIVCGVALLLLTVRGSDSRAASSTLGRAAR